MTPMQEQYQKIKAEYKDFIVLFRLGDFYEAFNEDAITLSKVLGITLTGRGKDDKRTPMAGIPHHALATYMPKMVEASLKVVIADQVEEAVPGKLVERKVTKVVTPGTVMDENSLDASKNNFIACFYRFVDKKQTFYLLSYCDLTTGLLQVFSTQSLNQLKLELNKVNPSEILTAVKDYEFLKGIYSRPIEKAEDSKFDLGYASEILLSQLQVLSLRGFGIEDIDPLIIVAGVLINFLQEYQRSELKHIKTIRKYQYSDYMQLDFETIRNLELVYSANGNDKNTLYGVLNQAATAMGKRKLRNWIIYPLINPDILQDRLDSVETFYNNPILASDIDSNLSNIADIERIMGRIGVQSANPRDLIALKNSLLNIEQLIKQVRTNTKLSKRLNMFVEKLAASDSELLSAVNK
ncbi:partial DNA mismatch repair protein MutS, partial [Patescibacteria group bacterium]